MASPFSVGSPFIELQQTDSTNNYATGLVHEGLAPGGTAVFAHHQTAGKGQRGRQWAGASGQNIALSVVVQPPGLPLSQSFLLSMATAVGLCHWLAKTTGEEFSIKWPNDIYWRDRKAAGILIENSVQGADWKAAVVGMGVNVNQTHFEGLEGKAVSLKQITGRSFSPPALARELCGFLSQAYHQMNTTPAETGHQYHQHLYKRQQTARFRQGNRVFAACVEGVSAGGELVLRHAVEERFAVGEVEWLP